MTTKSNLLISATRSRCKRLSLVILACICVAFAKAQSSFPNLKNCIVVTDYMPADGSVDVTDAIQKLIDENPNRTIFFPDGVYNVSKSILTPAHPQKSVHLQLCNYARIQAIGDWKEGGAVIRLGASHPANDINTPGSNYGLTGGIIDGGGVADGISIDGGRETRILEVSIKNTRVGIHVKYGANSGSSDADIMNVNIVGNNQKDAVGVLVEGFDNTFTNMRIASVNIGVWLKGAGNSLRNIHPLYIFGDTQDYPSSIGFRIDNNDNWLYYCYSDQMATAFRIAKDVRVKMTDCLCWWYNGWVPFQTAIECDGQLHTIINSVRVGFNWDCKDTRILKAAPGGPGRLIDPMLPGGYNLDEVEKSYVK